MRVNPRFVALLLALVAFAAPATVPAANAANVPSATIVHTINPSLPGTYMFTPDDVTVVVLLTVENATARAQSYTLKNKLTGATVPATATTGNVAGFGTTAWNLVGRSGEYELTAAPSGGFTPPARVVVL